MWKLSWFLELYPSCANHPRFNHRHADADLMNMISTSTPPADLDKISMFASHVAKYKQKARMLLSFPSPALFMSQKALNRRKKIRQIALQSFLSILSGNPTCQFNRESLWDCCWPTLGYLQPFSKPRGAKPNWTSKRTWINCGTGQVDLELLPLNRPLFFVDVARAWHFTTYQLWYCNFSCRVFWSRVAWIYATWVPATRRASKQWPSSWPNSTVSSPTSQLHWRMERWWRSKPLLAQQRYL